MSDAEQSVPGPDLAGYQRKYLRSLAHDLKPVVHVGDAGISDALVAALDAALAQHELVKVRLHQPEDKKRSAAQLASSTGAQLCGVVGHTVILYRANPEDPKIELPSRSSSG
jgi:RNA-binding protein